MRFAIQVAVRRSCSFYGSHRFESPSPPSVGKGEGLVEMLDEVRPWNLFRAEPADMGRELLAIYEAEVPGLELLDEPDERHFGCIIDSCKHRFGKEGPSDRHAVESADQTTVLPCLDGMSVAEFVQTYIGVEHVTRDPRSSLGILRARPCALFHDTPKAGIERDGKHVRAKPSLEAVRDMELVRKQDGARIRRPPEDGLIVVVPGKDAMPIGFEQPLRTEIASYREETFRGCPINRWKTKFVPIQAEHHPVRYVKQGKKTMPR